MKIALIILILCFSCSNSSRVVSSISFNKNFERLNDNIYEYNTVVILTKKKIQQASKHNTSIHVATSTMVLYDNINGDTISSFYANSIFYGSGTKLTGYFLPDSFAQLSEDVTLVYRIQSGYKIKMNNINIKNHLIERYSETLSGILSNLENMKLIDKKLLKK